MKTDAAADKARWSKSPEKVGWEEEGVRDASALGLTNLNFDEEGGGRRILGKKALKAEISSHLSRQP